MVTTKKTVARLLNTAHRIMTPDTAPVTAVYSDAPASPQDAVALAECAGNLAAWCNKQTGITNRMIVTWFITIAVCTTVILVCGLDSYYTTTIAVMCATVGTLDIMWRCFLHTWEQMRMKSLMREMDMAIQHITVV